MFNATTHEFGDLFQNRTATLLIDDQNTFHVFFGSALLPALRNTGTISLVGFVE